MRRLIALVVIACLSACQDIAGTIKVPECPVVRPTTGTVPLGCIYDAAGNLVGG